MGKQDVPTLSFLATRPSSKNLEVIQKGCLQLKHDMQVEHENLELSDSSAEN